MDNQNQLPQSTQSNSIPTNKPLNPYRRNWPRWLLVYFVIAILIYGGAYLVLSRKTSKSYPINYPNPTITIQPTVASDQTSNWKTYRNEGFGFEFSYPKVFDEDGLCTLREGTDTEARFHIVLGNSIDVLVFDAGGLSSEQYITKHFPSGGIEQETKQKIHIEDKEGTRIIYRRGGLGRYGEVTVFDKGGKIYELSYFARPNCLHADRFNESELLVFQKILSTFRFIKNAKIVTRGQIQNFCDRLEPRGTPQKPIHTKIQPGHSKEYFTLKFVEGSDIRLREGKFISLTGEDLTTLYNVLNKFKIVQIERGFSRSEEEIQVEKARVEVKSCRQQADFNLYYVVRVPLEQDNEKFIDMLNELSIVEIAYPNSLPAPLP